MDAPNKVLIFGVSGQDGAYLSQLLLERGHEVHGTTRDRELVRLQNLVQLGIADRVTIHSADPTDFRSVLQVVGDVGPGQIYNLAGQSSVGLSFAQPLSTFESILNSTWNILESMRFLRSKARFYNAASSESFGNTEAPADEKTPFKPVSPYGVAKAAAFWTTANYRQAYGLFACSGILFNHESPLRPARFVTQKVVRGAVDILHGRTRVLELGDLSIARDWGWAPEYVDAMARIAASDEPNDFVIATGETNTLKDFVAATFEAMGLDYSAHVVVSAELLRPADISHSAGNPAKAERLLNWRSQTKMRRVVEKLVEAELMRRRAPA